MSERQRTLVGVPFYDGEGIEVLDQCISDINQCLIELDIDSEIVIGINGPRVSLKQTPLSKIIDRSKYNADVKFIRTLPGIVKSEQAIGRYALEKGYERIFLTDTDISRLPDSLKNMWNEGDKPVVGSNYSTYPLEIISAAGVNFTREEIAYAKIFEADKHPVASKFTRQFRPSKRLKGSLLLVETKIISSMFDSQGITSDSRMNRVVPESERQLITSAAFMHYPRTNIIDHAKARLRHYMAAEAVNDLDSFAKKSIFYSARVADVIAKRIQATNHPDADEIASNFLLQSALRKKLSEIFSLIVSRRSVVTTGSINSRVENIENVRVNSYEEACITISTILNQINWDNLNCQESNGRGITQENMPRVPLDLTKFLDNYRYRQIIDYYLSSN